MFCNVIGGLHNNPPNYRKGAKSSYLQGLKIYLKNMMYMIIVVFQQG